MRPQTPEEIKIFKKVSAYVKHSHNLLTLTNYCGYQVTETIRAWVRKGRIPGVAMSRLNAFFKENK